MTASIPTESELDQRFERLFKIMGSDHFLQTSGIGNEVPLFIQPYEIQVQDAVGVL